LALEEGVAVQERDLLNRRGSMIEHRQGKEQDHIFLCNKTPSSFMVEKYLTDLVQAEQPVI
jgi:hypothetical protein